MIPDALFEQLTTLHQEGKDNKDLKRVCNQLKTLLIRMNPNLVVATNRKRKNSTSGQQEPIKSPKSTVAMDTNSSPVVNGNSDESDMEVEEEVAEKIDEGKKIKKEKGGKKKKMKENGETGCDTKTDESPKSKKKKSKKGNK